MEMTERDEFLTSLLRMSKRMVSKEEEEKTNYIRVSPKQPTRKSTEGKKEKERSFKTVSYF